MTSPSLEFSEAIRSAGLIPPDVIEPGKFHKFPGEGKGSRNTAAWCKLFPDGTGGIFGDYSTGLSDGWQAKRVKPFSATERAAFKRHVAEARRKALNPPVQTSAPNATIKDLCDEYFDRHISATYRRPHHVRGYLDKIIEKLGTKKVAEITRAEIVEFLKNYTARGKVAANRVLAIFRQTLDYGVEIGWLDHSPADKVTRRAAGGEEKPRERTLTDEEIRALWAIPEPHGPLFHFLLITAQRIGEAQLATPENVNGDVWRIPAEHAKNGRAHLVHLSPLALAEIKRMPAGRDRVFGIRSTTGAQAWLHRWCDRNGIAPRFTPHDLRRTAATRMNEIGIAPHVVEKVLNHTLQGVMGTYNRAEYLQERETALLAWSAELARIVNITVPGAVHRESGAGGAVTPSAPDQAQHLKGDLHHG